MICNICNRKIDDDASDCPFCSAFYCESCEEMRNDATDEGDNICLECQTQRAISRAEAYQDMMN